MVAYTKLFHLSDIHVRQHQRHDEYREVFEELYRMLREQGDARSILVCTGDVLHSKTQLTPECIALTREFFTRVGAIMTTVVIAGNHDANLSNLERMDALTPILESVDVHYLRDTGVYEFENLSLAVVSVFDETFPPMEQHRPGTLRVALYHGTLNGARTDQGFRLQAPRKLSEFSAYDLVLLGDIHRHQFLSPRAAYAGSLIQQNYGEALDHHGFVRWDLDDMTSAFAEVPNRYGYATFSLIDDVLEAPGHLPERCQVRLLHSRSSPERIQATAAVLERDHGCSVIVAPHKRDRRPPSPVHGQPTARGRDDQAVEAREAAAVDYEQLIRDVCDRDDVDAATVDAVLERHRALFPGVCGGGQGVRWQLLRLDFANLFCFGPKNSVDFTKCRAVTGLLAPNHTGKSALIDIVLYALFDKCSRGRTVSDYVNRDSSNFACTVTFRVGDTTYRIEKRGHCKDAATAKDPLYRKVDVNMVLACKAPQGWVTLNESTLAQTKKKVVELIGDLNDFVLTSVALQDQVLGMLAMSQADRKTLISKLFRLDIFEPLLKQVKKDLAARKASLQELEHLGTGVGVDDLEADLATHAATCDQLDLDLVVQETQAETLQRKLVALHQGLDATTPTCGDVDQERQRLEARIAAHATPTPIPDLETRRDALLQAIVPLVGDPIPLDAPTRLEATTSTLRRTKDALRDAKKAITEARRRVKKCLQQQGVLRDLERLETESAGVDARLDQARRSLENLGNLRVAPGCDCCQANLRTFAPEKATVVAALPELEATSGKLRKQVAAIRRRKAFTPQADRDYVEAQRRVDGLEADVQRHQQALPPLDAAVGDLKTQVRDLKHQETVRCKNRGCKEELATVEDQLRRGGIHRDAVAALQRLGRHEAQIRRNETLRGDIAEAQRACDGARGARDALRARLVTAGQLVARTEQALEERRRVDARARVLATEVRVLAALQKCYHVNGIPCTLMETYVPEVQNEVNRILHHIAPFMVEISVQHHSVEFYKIPDNGGARVHLECTSGYEKFVASLALRIAFRNFSLIGQPDFMILDEGFSSADSTNVASFGPLFRYLREHFRFVLMVSHINELKQEVDCQLPLTQHGGRSQIMF
jgi:DNA repair exonuclease SbcCD ATPase subunit